MQTQTPRRIARELALLSLSQRPQSLEKLENQEISDLLLAAIRTLTTEAQDALTNASSELQRSSDRLLASEIRAADVESARVMVSEAVEVTTSAINRLGVALEMPEWIQLANQQEVRSYTISVVGTVSAKVKQIDEILGNALVDWQVHRLAKIDRDILRIAIAEILFLGIPDRIAINEAVDIAKRYSSDEGHKFINGVMRRVTEQLKAPTAPVS
ncbi:transcription antitermination factor NusB [Synechocystis sp. PCC 7509]|uniref:transcription antitermination factor NusB n=1 Tax=Synechocystis sp. PCC 7509 TaxID=927677 RepID=UPI0002ABB25A|nr:transcription antitermination factor NusB [Synechocystis sp. PCC 7509]